MKKILVLQRGWVVVGNVEYNGQYVTWTDGSVIRRWGTTNGLGQLALEGPTSNTRLDPCGSGRTHELAVIMELDCTVDKWT